MRLRAKGNVKIRRGPWLRLKVPLPTRRSNRKLSWLCDRRASTIVEFALVAPLFILLLFGLLETSLIYFAQETLETAGEASLRLVVTGAVSDDVAGRSRLQSTACAQLPGYMDCDALRFDLSSAPTMSGVGRTPSPTYNTNIDRFAIGAPGDIVVLRLLYQWPLSLSPFSIVVRQAPSDHGHLLVATRVAKAEAYR